MLRNSTVLIRNSTDFTESLSGLSPLCASSMYTYMYTYIHTHYELLPNHTYYGFCNIQLFVGVCLALKPMRVRKEDDSGLPLKTNSLCSSAYSYKLIYLNKAMTIN